MITIAETTEQTADVEGVLRVCSTLAHFIEVWWTIVDGVMAWLVDFNEFIEGSFTGARLSRNAK